MNKLYCIYAYICVYGSTTMYICQYLSYFLHISKENRGKNYNLLTLNFILFV